MGRKKRQLVSTRLRRTQEHKLSAGPSSTDITCIESSNGETRAVPLLLLIELQQQYELLECSVKCIGTTVHLGCWCVMLFTFRVLDAKLKQLFHTMDNPVCDLLNRERRKKKQIVKHTTHTPFHVART